MITAFKRVSTGYYEVCNMNKSKTIYYSTLGYIRKQDTGPDKWTVETPKGVVVSGAPTYRLAKEEAMNVLNNVQYP